MLRGMIVVSWLALCVVNPLARASAQEIPVEDVKATAGRLIDEIYNQGSVTAISDGLAEDYVRHPGNLDRGGLLNNVLALRLAMPDLQATTELLIAEANWAALRLQLRGTLQNDLALLDTTPVPPNGQVITMTVHIVLRFNDQGLIAEEWNGFDNLSFLAQVGAIPAPASTPDSAFSQPEILALGMEEQNKAIIQGYFEALNQGDFSGLGERLRPDFVGHNPFGTLDRGGQVRDLSLLRGALPDLTVSVDQMFSEGNWTAVLHTMRGTFTADLFTADGTAILPTGRSLELLTVVFFRFDDTGAIVETWELYDSWSLLTQLGLLPTA